MLIALENRVLLMKGTGRYSPYLPHSLASVHIEMMAQRVALSEELQQKPV
jgi:hypothetical protein